MNIILFDDHQFVLDSISTFLRAKGAHVIGTYTHKNTVIETIKNNKEIDLLISDVLTDEEIGLSLFEEIQKMKLPLKVVAYSSIHSDFVKQFLFEYGVMAFVNKKEPLEKLWEAIELVYLNERYKKQYTPEIVPPQLTPKEHEIARYLAKGLASKEIALLTNTSVNTINNQKSHLLAKFDCTNSTELALRLLQMGYLKM
ncbi:response regulator transcription factor [Flexibacter flexilis]|nr:response regulator transcription factor [Flexibacter flexilis]